AICRSRACCRRFRAGRAVSVTRASPETIPPRPQPIRTSSVSAADADNAHRIVSQSVYFFGNGSAEGTKDMKIVLGGKGANLAEMTNLGVPVPPGFTIACDVCIAYLWSSGSRSADARKPQFDRTALEAEVASNLERLEETSGKKFGDF